MYLTTQSIVKNFPSNAILLIGDQGRRTEEKDQYYQKLKEQVPCEVHYFDFDCGAYFARNRLVERARSLECPFCLIGADSIGFIGQYNFTPIINFLLQDNKRALVGFDLKDSKCNWEYLMELTQNSIQFSYSNEYIQFDNIKFKRIDICRNIYLAKTQILLDVPYDEELKLGGHELNFINLKNAGYSCYWTDKYIFQRYSSFDNWEGINISSKEYLDCRKRIGMYKNLAMKKLNINGWVKMPKKI
jgi:hypothetical protein